MAKSSNPVALVYLTIAVLLLLFLSSGPSRPHRTHRRLKLRPASASGDVSGDLAGGHRRIPFDPLIADIELHRDDREWERVHYFPHAGGGEEAPAAEAQPEWEEYMDAEDYINNEDRFNVSGRIESLFPKIDVAPVDGFVSSEELAEWNLKQAEKDLMHRSKLDLEVHDKNRDGFISFQEYQPPSWAHRFHENSTTGWWKEEHFNASDMDGNDLLNLTEYNDFLHPADSRNTKLIQWLCTEEIRERDKDKDGKINFQEYFSGLFDSLRNFGEVYNSSHHSDTDTSAEASAKTLFQQLDLDNDGVLSGDELKPVIHNLHPSEHYYAKQQADYVIQEADTDKDGRLSLKEMINNPYVFYSSIFSEEDAYWHHDEFR